MPGCGIVLRSLPRFLSPANWPVPVCAIALGLFVIGLLAFLSDDGPTDHFALGRLLSF